MNAARSINCTNCGAGLDVLGGGRVTVKVCGYCGAALDANDAFRVLEVWDGMERPESPFRLGMRGEIDGVAFTIIGTLGQEERYEGQVWDWVDHQLFSPTHGYAWLTVDDGHVEFTRKVRDWPFGTFVGTDLVERSESPPSRDWRGRTFRYYESGTWRTTYVEGEFNWRPVRGAQGVAVAMLSTDLPSRMLTYVETVDGANRGEREVEVSRYCPEAIAAFGAEVIAPVGPHPLRPFVPVKGRWIDRLFFGALTAASLVLGFGLMFGGAGVEVYTGPPSRLPEALSFDVADASRPVEIRLRQDVSNDFVVYGLSLTGPNGESLAQTEREISYYFGVEDGESWTEGSRTATLGFAPVSTGLHTLAIARDATGADGNLSVTVEAGRSNPVWLLMAGFLFLLAFAFVSSARLRHRMMRWRGSDWSDD